MIESIIDLEEQLLSIKSYSNNSQCKLYVFYGEAEKIIEQLIQKAQIDAIFSNKDYTPFSKRRKTEMLA